METKSINRILGVTSLWAMTAFWITNTQKSRIALRQSPFELTKPYFLILRSSVVFLTAESIWLVAVPR